MAQLTRRIWQLEQEVAELRRREGLPSRKGSQTPMPAPPPPAREETVQEAPSADAAAVRKRTGVVTEANVVGTWLARAGVVAILVGAGFAFKYAVDRGLIGPSARVAIGLAAGLAFIACGEVAARRHWDLFAQAVSGGGIALWYLSILSAQHLFDLISVPVAFVALIGVTAVATVLAFRHDSAALAVLALVGGFLNPFLVGADRLEPVAFLGYVAALDVLVLAVAPKRWPNVDRVALLGTIAVVLAVTPQESFAQRVGFSTVLFAVFLTVPFVRALLAKDGEHERSAAYGSDVLAGTAATYGGYMLWVLTENHAGWRGVFTLALAALYAGMTVLGHAMDLREDAASTARVAFVLVAVFVPIQYRGVQIGAGWAAEGLVLMLVHARGYGLGRLRLPADVLLGGGAAVVVMALAEEYPPPTLFLNGPALCVAIVIACTATAGLVARGAQPTPAATEPLSPPFFWPLVANVVAIIWLSQELVAELSRRFADPTQPVQFGLTALWASYAAVLLGIGVATKTQWTRLAGVFGFAVVVGKLVLVDLWLLRTSYRIVVFIGLGVLLLVCSVMYQRLRDFVLADEEEPEPAVPTEPAKPAAQRKPAARKPPPPKRS